MDSSAYGWNRAWHLKLEQWTYVLRLKYMYFEAQKCSALCTLEKLLLQVLTVSVSRTPLAICTTACMVSTASNSISLSSCMSLQYVLGKPWYKGNKTSNSQHYRQRTGSWGSNAEQSQMRAAKLRPNRFRLEQIVLHIYWTKIGKWKQYTRANLKTNLQLSWNHQSAPEMWWTVDWTQCTSK